MLHLDQLPASKKYLLDYKWNIHMITQSIEISSSDFTWLILYSILP